MCLYYGISSKQQGPFSMPGATRCHVNMAGHSPSSCIFCCFNEWGKFCQANTASGRYYTCVRCFFMYHTHARPGTQYVVFFATLKSSFISWVGMNMLENILPEKTAGRRRGLWEAWVGMWGSSCQTYQFLECFSSCFDLVVCGP